MEGVNQILYRSIPPSFRARNRKLQRARPAVIVIDPVRFSFPFSTEKPRDPAAEDEIPSRNVISIWTTDCLFHIFVFVWTTHTPQSTSWYFSPSVFGWKLAIEGLLTYRTSRPGVPVARIDCVICPSTAAAVIRSNRYHWLHLSSEPLTAFRCRFAPGFETRHIKTDERKLKRLN